jgi:predicted aspartyl protease
MPAVFLEITLEAGRKVSVKALLNSGAQDLEVVVPRSVWKQMGAKRERRCGLIFGGKSFLSETCRVKAEVRNPETGEVRTAELDCSVLPDKELDCVLLGTEAQAKLGVIPNTKSGKPLFL